jgi:hypothetical protein
MRDLVHPSLSDFQEKWQPRLLSSASPVPVPQRSWRKRFPAESEILLSEQWFGSRHVSVEDLAKLANSGVGNRVLFIAAMMWGRGPKNGRLMPKFVKVATHEHFEGILLETRELILKGKPVEAYQVWIDSGLNGIRESFFTKWFFVCGLDSRSSGLQPLVLDAHVWKSLRAIGWSSERQTGKKYRRAQAEAYGAYLEAVRVWSDQLSSDRILISPLQLEQFFFRQNGRDLR